MSLLRKLFRGPRWQQFGQRTGRLSRRALDRVLDRLVPVPPNLGIDAVGDVRRVLLVRPNFRIGNILLATPLVFAARERFPAAQVEMLVGETTRSLLGGLPVDAIHCVSRLHILFPWRFVALFIGLRRRRFDVAIAADPGSFSGGLYTFLSGARYRIGWNGRGDRFVNVRLSRGPVTHAYESAPALARSMGATCADRPIYAVSRAEDEAALRILADLGLAVDGAIRPFVGVFVGGHLRKRWPQTLWLAFARELERLAVPFVIFLGPEEAAFSARLHAELSPSARILPPQPLRTFAAVLARARLFVSPDSGPMHLAAALRVPVLALLQMERSEFYRPHGAEDRALVRPTPEMAAEAVCGALG